MMAMSPLAPRKGCETTLRTLKGSNVADSTACMSCFGGLDVAVQPDQNTNN